MFELEDLNTGTHIIWMVEPDTGTRVYQAEIRPTEGQYQVFAAADPARSIDGRSYGWLDDALEGFRAWFGFINR